MEGFARSKKQVGGKLRTPEVRLKRVAKLPTKDMSLFFRSMAITVGRKGIDMVVKYHYFLRSETSKMAIGE